MITFAKITPGHGDDFTTGCLIDYNYLITHYKMIAIDESKEKTLDADPKARQQINFSGNLRGPNNMVIFFIIERIYFRFFTRTVIVL